MMPWTYAGPSASEISEALPGSSRKPSARGWWTLRGFCHGSGEKRGSTSLSIADREDGQGVSVACFRGCDRPTIIAALEHTTGWDSPEHLDAGRYQGAHVPSEERPRARRTRRSAHPTAAGTDHQDGG